MDRAARLPAASPGTVWWCEYGPSAMRFSAGPTETTVAYAKLARVTRHRMTYEFHLRGKRAGRLALPDALVSEEALKLVLDGIAAAGGSPATE